MAKPDCVHIAQMLGQNQYLNFENCCVQNYTLAVKDPNYASVVPNYIEETVPITNAAIQTIHPFGDDWQFTSKIVSKSRN